MGRTTLHQEGSPMRSFSIEGEPGREEIITVVTKEVPRLDWLPQGNSEPLQMNYPCLLC